jgi:hypothetical protein
LADRVDGFRQACIEDQVDKVTRNQRRRGPRRVKAILKRRPEDGLETLRAMERFSDGCATIASNFRTLRDRIAARGYLVPDELEMAFLWFGVGSVEESVATHVRGYTLYMLNLRCTPGVPPEEWAARLDRANRPAALLAISDEDLIPADPRVCAERLCAMFENKREEYLAEADRLRREVEEPANLRQLKKASILTGADARWASRNYTDARIGFDRAHKALYQTLERDQQLELDREGDDGSSGPTGSAELSGSDVPVAAAPSDPLPVPLEEVTQSPDEGQGAAADARPEVEQKSPNGTQIAPLVLMEVPPSQPETAQHPRPDHGVPFCAPGGIAEPQPSPRLAPAPHAFATSRSAIQGRFHDAGPGPAPGPGRPHGILILCLLALGFLALRAAQGPVRYVRDPSRARRVTMESIRAAQRPVRCVQRTVGVPWSLAVRFTHPTTAAMSPVGVPRSLAVRFTHPRTAATSLASRRLAPEPRFQPRRE